MHSHFLYRFYYMDGHLLLVMVTMLSFVMCSVFANEESTRNTHSINQAAAFYYSNKIHNNNVNNIDVDGDKDPLSDDKTYSKHIIQEVMPNYKKLKKDIDTKNTNTYINSFREAKRDTKIKNTNASISKPSSIFFIYNPSNKFNENLLHKSSLSTSVHHNQQNGHNVVDITAAESLAHQENIIEVDKFNMQSSQINIEKNENNNRNNGLPNINEVPIVTVTELPLEFLQSPSALDSIVLDNQKTKIDQHEETFKYLSNDNVEDTTEKIVKDIKEVVINDTIDNIPIDVNRTNATKTQGWDVSATDFSFNQAAETLTITKRLDNTIYQLNTTASSILDKQQINLTSEEIPIPVFSEWTQKQMEAAEKQAALEQQEQTFNHSAQRKNHTKNGHAKKMSALKVRLKNYASPDCGAKIIASNSEAKNTGAILSTSKDEYMLSPCGNRIWFIIELCEAIQAQRIDLANFELFSSSPKNFTVAVANRLPTRDWSNVGRFIAEDRRTVQSFELYPHLFGKYVRIDIHSHYAKEHFCPVSLCRVFGTSEFEAFETENLPNLQNQNLDDFDDDDEDDIIEEQEGRIKPNGPNIFKSASDAVLSIVKKAAEVLGKPEQNEKQINVKSLYQQQQKTLICQTPIIGYFNCTECNQKLKERINSLISCESQQLINLLHIPRLKYDLFTTHICDKTYGVTIETKNISISKIKDIRKSYYINILPIEYIGALCQLMVETERIRLKTLKEKIAKSSCSSSKRSSDHQQKVKEEENDNDKLMLTNVTLEKELNSDNNDISILNKRKKKITQTLPEMIELEMLSYNSPNKNDRLTITITDSSSMDEFTQVAKPDVESNMDFNILDDSTTMATTSILANNSTNIISSDSFTTPTPVSHSTSEIKSQIADVNIFNVPDIDPDRHSNIDSESLIPEDIYNNVESSKNAENDSTKYVSTGTDTNNGADVSPSEDTNSWENIDNLLSTSDTNIKTAQDVSTTGSVHNGNNLLQQQKIPGAPYTESVFIRLSNRIKTLELNMSLSGQYLEELSRRYKKQVEELQQTLSQQMLSVRMLEQRNRRHLELEQLYASHTTELKKELDDLTLQVHACIVVIIFVGAFILLALMVGALFYRSIRRDTKGVLSLYNNNINDNKKKHKKVVNNMTVLAMNVKKAKRRKSYEDLSNYRRQEISSNTYDFCNDKLDRNSHDRIEVLNNAASELTKGKNMLRQRKMSICYSSQNHVNYINGDNGTEEEGTQLQAEIISTKPNNKRKRAKHSWPNTAHSRIQAGHRLKELQLEVEKLCDENDSASIETIDNKLLLCDLTDSNHCIRRSRKKKEIHQRQQQLKRVELAPIEGSPLHDKSIQIPMKLDDDEELQTAVYDENLRCNTHDLDNFLLRSDIKDNEFMAENARSYLCTPSPKFQQISVFHYNENNISQSNSNDNGEDSDHYKMQKSNKLVKNVMMMNNNNNSIKSRLISPTFFKAPFKKSFKSKTTKKNTPHESTSWEWHRLKKTAPTALTSTVKATPTSNTYETAITTSHSLLPNVKKTLTKSSSLSPLSSETKLCTSNSSDRFSNYCQTSGTNTYHQHHAIKKHLLLTNNVEMDNLNDNNSHIDNNHLIINNNGYNGNGSSRSCGSSSTTSNSSNCSSNQSTNKKYNHCARTFNKIFRKVF